MKVFYVGNGKMIQEINKLSSLECVGLYNRNTELILNKPDIVIDFSHPDFIEKSVEKACLYQVPLLIGTTGFSNEKMAYLKEKSKIIPIIYSGNYSEGINLINIFFKMMRLKLNNYKIKINEIHHITKKDTPSGTAKLLAEHFNKCEISSFREKDIKGIHEIIMENDDEIIEIKHTALSRKLFALGVEKAINFIIEKEKGFYYFEDIFKPN